LGGEGDAGRRARVKGAERHGARACAAGMEEERSGKGRPRPHMNICGQAGCWPTRGAAFQ
jgi:hypothetical protein